MASRVRSKPLPKRTSTCPPGGLPEPPRRRPKPPPKMGPQTLLQTAPSSQDGGYDSWPKCGPSLEPFPKKFNRKFKKVELEFGRFLAGPLARKWPEPPGLETPPSRESLNILTNLPKNLGRFLAIGLATLWPFFFQCFTNLASNVSFADPRFGPHFGQNSWTIFWLRSVIWEAV